MGSRPVSGTGQAFRGNDGGVSWLPAPHGGGRVSNPRLQAPRYAVLGRTRGVTLTPALSRQGRGGKMERADTWVRPYGWSRAHPPVARQGRAGFEPAPTGAALRGVGPHEGSHPHPSPLPSRERGKSPHLNLPPKWGKRGITLPVRPSCMFRVMAGQTVPLLVKETVIQLGRPAKSNPRARTVAWASASPHRQGWATEE